MSDFTAARTAMVDCQVRPSDVTRYPIIQAMLATPRELYLPAAARDIAYSGEDISLGNGRYALAPRTLAKMLDALAVGSESLVLDVGCNYGYSTAVLSRMAQAVVAVEQDPDMAQSAIDTLLEDNADTAVVEEGPLSGGAPAHGPYDAIILHGAAQTVPQAIVDQLKEDGTIVALLSEGPLTYCAKGVKGRAGLSWRRVFDATGPILPGFETKKEFVF